MTEWSNTRGLPSFDQLKAIYADVPTNLFSGCSCSPLQQLLTVLIKLHHLNLGEQDLAYRFGIHSVKIL